MGRVAVGRWTRNLKAARTKTAKTPESRQNHEVRCRHDTPAPGSIPAGVGRSEDFGSGVDRA